MVIKIAQANTAKRMGRVSLDSQPEHSQECSGCRIELD